MTDKFKHLVQLVLLVLLPFVIYLLGGGAASAGVSAAAAVIAVVLYLIPSKGGSSLPADSEAECLLESGNYAEIEKSGLPASIKGFAKRLDSNMKDTYIGISDAADATIPLINQIAEIKKIAEHSSLVSSQVAASGHELTMTISEISETMNESARKASEAVSTATEGAEKIENNNEKSKLVGETMNKLADDIKELESEAMKIGDVVGVINDLSDQTNLLALNAAIEAARAGEAGRGFAVVADEVRKLAERTRKATDEIGDVVKGITESIRQAAGMSAKTSEAVMTQLEMNSEVADNFGEVSGSLEEINSLVTNVSVSISQQVEAAAQISENIESFRQDSDMLDGLGDTLKDSIEHLMASINKVDASVAHYKKGDKAAMFIRAKIAHANVLKAMQTAVINKHADMKIPDHANCMFGKAYYSKEYQEAFSGDSDFKAIEDPHKMAHKFADIVVEAVRTGDPDVHIKLKDFSSAVNDFKSAMNGMVTKLLG